MNTLPKLNFPARHLRARREADKTYVWDALRRSYLLLTPEEWVRRHVIGFLTGHCGVAPTSIVQEYPVQLNGTAQRADIVVAGGDGRPQLLVECKAADVRLTRSVYEQAARYNAVVGARYIMLTNGLETLLYELRTDCYKQIDRMPSLG